MAADLDRMNAAAAEYRDAKEAVRKTGAAADAAGRAFDAAAKRCSIAEEEFGRACRAWGGVLWESEKTDGH